MDHSFHWWGKKTQTKPKPTNQHHHHKKNTKTTQPKPELYSTLPAQLWKQIFYKFNILEIVQKQGIYNVVLSWQV